MILSGVFERFPRLKFVMTEAGCAWVPPLLDRLDWALESIRKTGATGEIRYGDEHILPRSATEYFHQNVWMGVSQPGPRTSPPATRSASTGSCGAATTRTTRAPTRTRASTCGPASAASPEAELKQFLVGERRQALRLRPRRAGPAGRRSSAPRVAEIAEPLDVIPDKTLERLPVTWTRRRSSDRAASLIADQTAGGTSDDDARPPAATDDERQRARSRQPRFRPRWRLTKAERHRGRAVARSHRRAGAARAAASRSTAPRSATP